jgi:hypothetical protein
MRRFFIVFAIGVLLAEAFAWKVMSAEPVTPAYVAPQEQASALAIPSQTMSPPVSIVVVTVCNQIVGVVASDSDGNVHPLNIEGLSDARLKLIIARISQRLVVDTGCKVEPDRQPIF